MSAQQNDQWEAQIQRLATDFAYPPTPDLTVAVTTRLGGRKRAAHRPRLIWAAMLLLVLLLVGMMGFPIVRAALLDWLQIGAVRIWLVEPPPTVTSTSPPVQTAPTTTPIASVLDLAGETTLFAARAQVDFPIRLPTLPTDLGDPDRVYLQHAEGDTVILVWMQPDQPQQVRISLHLLGPGAFVWKMQPPDIVEVRLNGAQAFWTQGPYYVQVGSGQSWGERRLVDGHVLIWTDSAMTYRLESDLTYGHDLFLAKGCTACHMHEAITAKWSTQTGPDLSNYEKTAPFLRLWLADPAAVKPTTEMPNLNLEPDEIEIMALVQNSLNNAGKMQTEC